MNQEKTKAIALAKLKNGEHPNDISDELDISITLVNEWAEDMSPDQMLAQEINYVALQKATELIEVEGKPDKESLEEALLTLSLAITKEIPAGLQDHHVAKCINMSANTIATLRNAFFDKPSAQIAVINNAAGEQSSSQVSYFQGTLKD